MSRDLFHPGHHVIGSTVVIKGARNLDGIDAELLAELAQRNALPHVEALHARNQRNAPLVDLGDDSNNVLALGKRHRREVAARARREQDRIGLVRATIQQPAQVARE